ncbi:hypothetical protein GOP47_0008269 [Adiantum capillus-veneris]|uniref:Pentatricopeptide repeat-containing protein n=1 Tax=Adiantum capillus-veneris TaxID=13818 RepID=A0A9D4UY85_ADICA|nr:hypothetical protein GOP47_0008269 [Adiantum capillus-veneris]
MGLVMEFLTDRVTMLVAERQELKIEVSTQTRKGLGINVSISQDLYVCLLQSYGRQRALTEGRELHGFIETCIRVFDIMPNQDAVSWNIMIAAFARAGQIKEAFTFFNSMEMEKFAPDEALQRMISRRSQAIYFPGWAKNARFQTKLHSSVQLVLALPSNRESSCMRITLQTNFHLM